MRRLCRYEADEAFSMCLFVDSIDWALSAQLRERQYNGRGERVFKDVYLSMIDFMQETETHEFGYNESGSIC